MDLTNELVKKLLKLSALSLKKEDKEEIKKYLKEALSHFEKIKTLDTKNVEPLFSPFENSLNLRKDKVNDFPEKEKLLDQSQQKQGHLIKTPLIIG